MYVEFFFICSSTHRMQDYMECYEKQMATYT